MILKDRFLTQLAPDICRKLQKQEFGPNQSIKKLLQLAQMVYHGKKYTKENGKIKEPTKDMLWLCFCGVFRMPPYT